jgi:DNA-binding Lrp family transcriptional regulator
MQLDNIDRAIIRILQKEGRISNNDLADRVGLSASPCSRRVRLVDPARVGLGLTVFARVWLSRQDEETTSAFMEAVRKLPQVVECHLMAGDTDFLLRVVATDLEGYRRFQSEHLGRIPGVQSIKSDIPMQEVKRSWEVPV